MIRSAFRTLLHVIPIKSGLSAITNSRLARWSCSGLGKTSAQLRNGIRLEVDPQDFNGRMLLLFGTPDPKVVSICRDLLRPGDTFLDIGANYGAVGLLCSDIVGPTGEIHFYEPQSQLCGRIRKCIAGEKLTWCQLHEFGLLDTDGESAIALHPGHSGAASLARPAAGGETSETVPVRAAAPAIAEAVRNHAFGAKLDVEGAERAVLPAIVAHPGFRFVVFECNQSAERDWAWEFSKQRGLRYFGLRRSMWRISMEAVKDRKAMDGFHDLLAVASNDQLQTPWIGTPRQLAKTLWPK